MKETPLFYKMKFNVDDLVIKSLHNLLKYSREQLTPSNILIGGEPGIQVFSLQTSVIDEKILKKYHDIVVTQTFKHETKWVIENEDVSILKNFLDTHFSSHYQFRLDIMRPDSELGFHDNHPYPRVFIPLHENKAKFTIMHGNQKETHEYQPPECWYWDVRKMHSVRNFDTENERIMACFTIDPDIETKCKFD